MVAFLIGAGLALALASLVVSALTLQRVRSLQQKHHALDALPQAIAAQVTAALKADAEARARTITRYSGALATLLDAATQLVRELRAAADAHGLRASRTTPPAAEDAAGGGPDDAARPTTKMPDAPAGCAPAADDDEAEELTTVATRPVPGTVSAANGLRLGTGGAQ